MSRFNPDGKESAVAPATARNGPSSRLLQMIGLAVRARKVALGQDAVMKSIQSQTAYVVLVATDAGANGAKKYRDKCSFYHVPVAFVFDREVLGRACGRSNTVAVSVLDQGIAQTLIGFVREIYGGEAFGETSSL